MERPHAHLTEVTRVVLIHQNTVVVLTTGITAATGVGPVLADAAVAWIDDDDNKGRERVREKKATPHHGRRRLPAPRPLPAFPAADGVLQSRLLVMSCFCTARSQSWVESLVSALLRLDCFESSDVQPRGRERGWGRLPCLCLVPAHTCPRFFRLAFKRVGIAQYYCLVSGTDEPASQTWE